MPDALQSELHRSLVILRVNRGEFEESVAQGEAAVALARKVGDPRRLVRALITMCSALRIMDDGAALEPFARELRERAVAVDDENSVSWANVFFAVSPSVEISRARELFAQSIATQKKLGHHRTASLFYFHWALTELAAGNFAEALRAASQDFSALSLDTTALARAHGILSVCQLLSGNAPAAAAAARKQLELAKAVANPFDIRIAVSVLACSHPSADPGLLAKLMGYAGFTTNRSIFRFLAPKRDAAIAEAKRRLGETEFAALAAEGSSWDEEAASRAALRLLD